MGGALIVYLHHHPSLPSLLQLRFLWRASGTVPEYITTLLADLLTYIEVAKDKSDKERQLIKQRQARTHTQDKPHNHTNNPTQVTCLSAGGRTGAAAKPGGAGEDRRGARGEAGAHSEGEGHSGAADGEQTADGRRHRHTQQKAP